MLPKILSKSNRIVVSTFSSSKRYTGSIDQSTTGTKFSLFQLDGTLIDQQIIPHEQITPQQGWLEHNPQQIIKSTHQAINNVILRQQNNNQSFSRNKIIGVGLCNQRQTIVCWDKETGQPLNNAIVWSDSRTADVCHRFQNKYGTFKGVTGLPVSTYFSLFKILWILENNPIIVQKMKENKIRFGTIDSWVTYNLTGKYITDASNASRTYLCDVSKAQWDDNLLRIAQIPQTSLPQITNSFEDKGQINCGALKGINLKSILGDQQSSSFAHNLSHKQMKITYGTGCFMLNNMGTTPHFHDAFVTTILSKQKQHINYGYQASVECGGGTINWAKRLNLFEKYHQLNTLPNCPQELFFMPSFGSIFSPYWKQHTAGHFLGLGFNTTRFHLLQSILQGISFRLYDNVKSIQFKDIEKVIVDGGLCQNENFMQMQADLFGKQVEVRTLDTCWGVAKGAIKASNMQIKQKKFKTVNYHPRSNQTDKYRQKYEQWYQKRNNLYSL